MRRSSKRFLFAILLLLTASAVAYFSIDLKPSDEELKRVYESRRDSFTKLERLFTDDPALQYASASTLYRNFGRGSVSDSVPADEYQFIFKETEILSGFRNTGMELTFLSFPTFRRRLSGSEEFYEEKGYAVFLAPTERVEELVGSRRLYSRAEFKQIEDRWYIYQQVYEVKPE